MQRLFAPRQTAYTGGRMDTPREGRDSELSRRITVLLFFPRLDATPGPWLLFLASVCTFVAVRALELGI
ncbi:hypothetical protein [Ramlibacter pallidus]|uniref:Uncharacterized protein n=1 Tax=Ramlibacter pallidus TaxID=2780087 RepID=A0ABR9RZH9_9BURK|nr:hypothetical protein [Ramlibacter pallidus]MBE7366666.1 hypothetical protein [Ramlibacter pallidus]